MVKTKNLLDVITPEMMAFYYDHPIEFVEEIIFKGNNKDRGGEYFISDQQRSVLEALASGKRKVSIRSGRSCGKSVLDEWIVLWFLCTRPLSEVVITAPTFKQINGVLWTGLAKWIQESLLKPCFTITKNKIYANDNPDRWYATAITANKPESFQGYHNQHLLIIVDEASGVLDPIWNTLQGSLSEEDNIVVLSGNPTQTSGFFFDSHNKSRDSWACFHFSSANSPFATPEFIQDYKTRYGENHPLYKIHILGEFPSGSPDSYISLERVLAATQRQIKEGGDIQIGVDVAHFGDDSTAIAVRYGNKIFPLEKKAQTSIPDTTGLVLNTVKELRAKYNHKDIIRVCVDATGVGAGVADELALDRTNNIEVIPVNFGASGDDTHEYYATVLWSRLKDQIDQMELPEDTDLIDELSTRRYKITPTGKERIEPKSEFKRDFGRSPDSADAVILACANTANRSKVIRDFDYLDNSMVYNVQQKGYILGTGDKFCSVFQSKDRKFHILFCNWNVGKLYVIGETESDDPVINIARKIQSVGKFSKILGNERMFGTFKEDVSSQFRKYNVSIYDNYKYDEPGAIECLNLMVKNKTIIIDNGCSALIQQLRKWNFDNSQANMEIDYGMCYSLLNIISELKEKIIGKTYIKPFIEYSQERTTAIKKLGIHKNNKNKWQSW